MKIYKEITKLIVFAQKYLQLDCADTSFVRNCILDALGLTTFSSENADEVSDSISELLDGFVTAAVEENVFSLSDAPYYCDKIMGILSLRPSQLNAEFQKLYAESPKKATDYLYGYCVNNNYVKKAVLDKNPRFERDGLVVTVNLAKPEFRDPKKAQSGNAVAGGYPNCVICRENEGFCPRGKSNLRTVDITLNGEKWFWQYSPYGYFAEHGIAVNAEHTPMRVDRETFVKLLDFIDAFPHYFIGCNAALERIGGSVLAHDHFQGGREVLPLHNAKIKRFYSCKGFDDVIIGVVDWDGSVIRLVSANREHIAEVADRIRAFWSGYDNEKLGIVSHSGSVLHSCVSPTVYKRGEMYHMNIILRNNVTSDEFPDGVFHAHPEFHAIKKESIGLIEAQGLFILPGRLQSQLELVKQAVTSKNELTKDLADFKIIYDEMTEYIKINGVSADVACEAVLASVCRRILQNTAVFKNDADFGEFMTQCGFDDLHYTVKTEAGGRVNIIGEHIDYCGGKVLPASLSLKNTVYAKPNETNTVNLRWLTAPDAVSLDIDKLDCYKGVKYADYIAGCLKVLKDVGRKVIGCDMIYDCAVPFGSGLSSSAAIEVSTIAAMTALTGENIGAKEEAILAQRAEREYVGVNCGIMDQYASANGKADNAILLDCKSVSHTFVPLKLGEYALVIANTNKPHSLSNSKYNERREETEEALRVIRQKFDVNCLAEVSINQWENCKNLLGGKIRDRAEHVICECYRVEQAVEAMRRGDLAALGKLLNESHVSLKDKYEVSCRELDVLAFTAQSLPYCLGARMTGAGFGGSVVAIVLKSRIPEFIQTVGREYAKQIGYDADFYCAEITDSVIVKMSEE